MSRSLEKLAIDMELRSRRDLAPVEREDDEDETPPPPVPLSRQELKALLSRRPKGDR